MAKADAKPKTIKGCTPDGFAIYPRLNTPDEYQGKKSFKVTLRFTADEAAELLESVEAEGQKILAQTQEELTAKVTESKGQAKVKAQEKLDKLELHPAHVASVDDDGKPTGDIEFTFRTNSEYLDKKTEQIVQKKLKMFDTDNQPVTANVWGGSILAVAYEFFPYYNAASDSCGISLRIEGVQVVKLVSGSGGDGGSLGFKKRDDGFKGELTGAEDPDEVAVRMAEARAAAKASATGAGKPAADGAPPEF